MTNALTVYVCSNPKCGAVFAHDPQGHCPACFLPTGVGYSTRPREVSDISADGAASVRRAALSKGD